MFIRLVLIYFCIIPFRNPLPAYFKKAKHSNESLHQCKIITQSNVQYRQEEAILYEANTILSKDRIMISKPKPLLHKSFKMPCIEKNMKRTKTTSEMAPLEYPVRWCANLHGLLRRRARDLHHGRSQ